MSKRVNALEVRAKILGVLLKDARLAAGKSAKECADVVGCPVSVYSAYEQGQKSPSLPELELLGYFLEVPLTHFWGNQVLTRAEKPEAAQLSQNEITALRDRIIGAQLRQARTAAKIKIKDLAQQVGVSSGRLSAYEFGEKPIPLPELEAMVARLGLSVEDLLENKGTVGEWESTRRAFERFQNLPPELREFFTQPANESYLRLAQRLSELSAERLRGVAEALLDITY
jgi:transcriptional regulator with XRE-family HTH domain